MGGGGSRRKSSERRVKGTLLMHVRGVCLVAPWLVWLLGIDLAVSALLPLRPFFPDTVYHLSSRLAWTVWRWIQRIFEQTNGASIVISGDALPSGESAIVVANHVAWTDFYMIQALAIRAGMLGQCRYFFKRQLRAVPFLGWGLWAMGMPMVRRDWLKDQRRLDRVFRGIVSRRWPTWLISFSEATRYTPAKYAESKAWCSANGKPQPQHLLYPRTKGFVATVQNLRRAPHVKAVYDLAIAYQQGSQWQVAPTFWDSLSIPDLSADKALDVHTDSAGHRAGRAGPGFRFHVHVRRFPIDELPYTPDELALWLEQRWVEKGDWLESLRRTWADSSPVKNEPIHT